jgi:8-oxo-dGTP diphosphatase
MKIICEISEKTLGLKDFEVPENLYTLRKSVRALLFNNNKEIALQYLKNFGFHKLPGGGIELNETNEQALKREILEEVGCTIEITNELGAIIEYCNASKLIHISYAYTAKVVSIIQNPVLELSEIEEGQQTVWLKPDNAVINMKKDIPQKYEGYFIKAREISFIEHYMKSNQ